MFRGQIASFKNKVDNKVYYENVLLSNDGINWSSQGVGLYLESSGGYKCVAYAKGVPSALQDDELQVIVVGDKAIAGIVSIEPTVSGDIYTIRFTATTPGINANDIAYVESVINSEVYNEFGLKEVGAGGVKNNVIANKTSFPGTKSGYEGIIICDDDYNGSIHSASDYTNCITMVCNTSPYPVVAKGKFADERFGDSGADNVFEQGLKDISSRANIRGNKRKNTVNNGAHGTLHKSVIDAIIYVYENCEHAESSYRSVLRNAVNDAGSSCIIRD